MCQSSLYIRSAGLAITCLWLTSCGSLPRLEKIRLETIGRSYASTTLGEDRSALIQRLGKPQSRQKHKDTWETIADGSNGERLLTVYDRNHRVREGQYSSWRGDEHGMIRWRREFDYYLPAAPTPVPTPAPLKRRYFKHEFKLP